MNQAAIFDCTGLIVTKSTQRRAIVPRWRIRPPQLLAVGAAALLLANSVSSALAVTFPLQLFVNGSTTVYPISSANAAGGGPFATNFPGSDTTVNFGAPGSLAVAEQPGSGDGRNCLLMGQIDVADSSSTFSAADNTQSAAFNGGKPGDCNNPAPGSATTFQWAPPANPDVGQGQVLVYTVAEDGIVPIFDSASTGMPTSVSRDDLAQVFGCQKTAWNQIGVGGTSTATIVLQARETTSGTYDSFNKLDNLPFGAEQACIGDTTYHNANGGGGQLSDCGTGAKVTPAEGAAISYPVCWKTTTGPGLPVFTINAKNTNALPRVTANPDVVNSVKTHLNSLGYVGLGFASSAGISDFHVETVQASITTIHNCYNGGSPCYALQRKLYMAMLKFGVNAGRADTYARGTDFIDQVLSPGGQTMVGNTGFVPLIDNGRILDSDINMDFIVDISDLALVGLSGTWSTSAVGHAHWVRPDVNRDGTVDISDLSTIGLAANWNHTWSLPQK